MPNKDIHNNMMINADAAYKYSVDNLDTYNMQMVLRAYGYEFTENCANAQIKYAIKEGV